jgi:hypothetical protein
VDHVPESRCGKKKNYLGIAFFPVFAFFCDEGNFLKEKN